MPPPDFEFMNEEKNAHYAAVGRVALGWTRIEDELASTVQMLAGLGWRIGSCLTAQIPNSARMIDALWSLCELRSPGITKPQSFRKRTERLMSLGERRNRVVHDIWTFDPGVTTKWQLSAKRTLKNEQRVVPTSEVTQLAADIEEAFAEFIEFRYHLLNDLKLWPGNPRDDDE
jgi:hypothetical protein